MFDETAEIDVRNEKINYKVREHSHAKIPILYVVGKREAERKTVSIRRLGSQDQITLSMEDAISQLFKEAQAPNANL